MSARAFGMIWPLASAYARLGWAVRRAGWDDSDMWGDTGRALRWVYYYNSLFWLLYRDGVTGVKRSRVITATDFGVDEFRALDWTVLTPECLSLSGGNSSTDQQGKLPYPSSPDTQSAIDPLYPNASYGSCPVVPLYEDIRTTNQSTIP